MSGALDNWLSRVAETTAKNYSNWFSLFQDWLREHGDGFREYTADDLVRYQREADNGNRYKVLDAVQRWVMSLEDKRANTKKSYYRCVRSFFLHNRAELPRDPSFNIRGDKPPVKAKLTLENVRDICIRSKKAYRGIFLSMFQGAMGRREVTYWNKHGWQDLKQQLEEGARIIRATLPGRKQMRYEKPYYTLIGKDAIDAVKDYLPERPNRDDAIFYNQYGNPITSDDIWYYWHRQLKKLGLIEPKKPGNTGNRYGYNLHELRDLFRTQWEKSGVQVAVAEYLMGHVVDSNKYNKFYRDQGWTKRQYLKASRYLNILSSERPFGMVDQNEILEIKDSLRGEYEERIKSLERKNEQLENRFIKIEKLDLTKAEKYTPKELRELMIGKGEWVETENSPIKPLLECPKCHHIMNMITISGRQVAHCPECGKTYTYKQTG